MCGILDSGMDRRQLQYCAGDVRWTCFFLAFNAPQMWCDRGYLRLAHPFMTTRTIRKPLWRRSIPTRTIKASTSPPYPRTLPHIPTLTFLFSTEGGDDLVAVGSWEAGVSGRWPDFPEVGLREATGWVGIWRLSSRVMVYSLVLGSCLYCEMLAAGKCSRAVTAMLVRMALKRRVAASQHVIRRLRAGCRISAVTHMDWKTATL